MTRDLCEVATLRHQRPISIRRSATIVRRVEDGSPHLQLFLSIGAFVVCFALFGSVAAMMPAVSERLGLTEMQVGLALAIPVLLGSIGRIPVGMLADRYGGKIVYLSVLGFAIVPAFLFGLANTYWQVLTCACFTGVALSMFPVGVAFISNWYPPHRHGSALALLTLGSLGHSVPLFAAPLAVAWLGYRWGFWTFALAALCWLIVFAIWAEDPPWQSAPRRFAELLAPLARPMSWVLSAFYFLTLGCFLSLGSFLPHFLTSAFGVSKTDAGIRAAGFVVATTLARPFGGIIADRVGGRRVLLLIFPTIAVTSLFLTSSLMVCFTVGALATAIAVGVGSGAIFKLVPEHFPRTVGSVTGLVGAVGGLGGFFPPIALGFFRSTTGSFSPGFVCLSLFALGCFALCALTVPHARS